MKKLALFLWLALSMPLLAQNASLNANVTDSDGQPWINGKYSISFVPPPGYTGHVYTFNGSSYTPPTVPFTGLLSASGVFQYAQIPRNDFIQPTGSQWKVCLTPLASVPSCSATNVTVNAASMDLTSTLVLKAPRFASSNVVTGSYGYRDIEVTPTPIIGGFYFNVLTGLRLWNGTEFIASGGGGPTTSVTYYAGFPTGTIDGTNKVFTIPQNCLDNTASAWENFPLVIGVGFTLSGTTVTYTNAPQIGDNVYLQCVTSATGISFFQGVPVGAIDGSNVTFSIANQPLPGTLVVWQNWPLTAGTGYNITGTTIVFTNPPQPGDTVFVQYQF